MRQVLVLLGVLIVLAICGFVGYINLGNTLVPTPIPTSEKTYNEFYRDAGRAALEMLLTTREKLGVPSLSAAVAVDQQIVWAGAVGWAALEDRLSATPDTRYRVGSTSKSITASIAARMVDQGRLDIDTPIKNYVTDLPNPEWMELTARQLMSHTSGIPGYEANDDVWGLWQTLTLWRRFEDAKASLAVFDDSKLMYEPGTSFLYSSFDVVLLSAVIEKLSGEIFPKIMNTEVNQPLSLQNTFADGQPGSAQNQAEYYEVFPNGLKPWRKVDLSLKWAGGGLVSTPSDLVRIGAAWLNPAYISTATHDEFWTPQTLSNGEVNEQNYAIGWRADNTGIGGRQLERRHHGGVSKGSMNWLVVYPSERLVVDISMNSVVPEFWDFAKVEQDISALFLDAKALK